MPKKFSRPPISGVFSQTKVSTIGTGTTARKSETVSYFFARELEEGLLEVQPLGDNVVLGEPVKVSLDEFLAQYMPEPQLSQQRAKAETEREGEIRKAVARGDKFYNQGKTYSAEYEYGKALALDEENIRANFGIGLCYVERGETDKARVVLGRLVRLEAAFGDEHKHLFNEFGISLRKSGMEAEALTYYTRALELCPSDENLHYNMARASFNLGEIQEAQLHLEQCLVINPGHEEARRFASYIQRRRTGGA